MTVDATGTLTPTVPVTVPVTTGHAIARVYNLADAGPPIFVKADGGAIAPGIGTPVDPGEHIELSVSPTFGTRPEVKIVSAGAQPYRLQLLVRFTTTPHATRPGRPQPPSTPTPPG